jgi:hypothetical protein
MIDSQRDGFPDHNHARLHRQWVAAYRAWIQVADDQAMTSTGLTNVQRAALRRYRAAETAYFTHLRRSTDPKLAGRGSTATELGTARTMTPEQARAAHNAYDRLYHYLSADAVPHMASEAELENAIFGNFLATDTLLVILARLRGKTFDQVLAALPERDEGHPPGPGARYTWETAAHQLRYMHAKSWQRRPEPGYTYSLPITFRSSFNLVVAAAIEVAAETQTSTRQLIGTLRDAAAVATK